MTAITVNRHAAEVSSLNGEERRRALAVALDEVDSRLPLISGVYSDSTFEAVELARDAKTEGRVVSRLFRRPCLYGVSSYEPKWPHAILL